MELSKFQHIRIKGFFGKWSAYDYYTDVQDGGELIILENDDLRDEALKLVCRVVGESGLELVGTFTGKTSELRDTVKQVVHNNQ